LLRHALLQAGVRSLLQLPELLLHGRDRFVAGCDLALITLAFGELQRSVEAALRVAVDCRLELLFVRERRAVPALNGLKVFAVVVGDVTRQVLRFEIERARENFSLRVRNQFSC
jgi:hypothetical protein